MPEDADADDVAPAGQQAQRPPEYKALFRHANSSDHFRFGIRVTRGSVRSVLGIEQIVAVVASFLVLRAVAICVVKHIEEHASPD